MTQIGLFEAMADGFAGRILCLTIDAEVRIVEADAGEKAGNYLSLLIDDPTLIQPIYANLFQSGSDPTAHILLWNRPAKRKELS